ncbi:MAG: GWxTD domain-containing protein [Bacteroidota bacterium]
MKKSILFIFAALCWLNSLALDTSVAFATFNGPNSPFVEIYLQVIGKTVEYQAVDSTHYKAAVEVIIMFRKNGEIVKFDKYNLRSPLSTFAQDFIDLKRFALENGTYELEVSVTDLNKKENTKTFRSEVALDYGNTNLQQSDVQLLASIEQNDATNNPFVKNGYYMEPLPYNFYHKKTSKLIFYNEIYNANLTLSKDMLIRYAIEKVENGKSETVMLGHKKRQPKSINILLIQMDISKLESGNYKLLVEVRNRDQVLLNSKEVAFQRSNPYLQLSKIAESPVEQFVNNLDLKELRYSLKSIAMIVPMNDTELINMLLANNDMDAQRRYLFNFWAQMDPNAPEEAYNKYMNVARAVDKTYYSGFGYGFETDRGWMFMRYGKPDDIVTVENETAAPPYEIWVYNDMPKTAQGLVKILFYNPSLAKGNYQLLHCTINGELQNPNWEEELYRDGEVGEPNANSRDAFHVNRRARELFADF